MLVDSSGSRKPLASPSATQLRDQTFRRRPVDELQDARIGERAPVEVG